MPYKHIEDRQRRDRERYAGVRDAAIAVATAAAQAATGRHGSMTAHCCPLCKTLLEQTGNWYTKGCQHKALWKRGAKLTKKQKFGRDLRLLPQVRGRQGINPG